MILFFNKEFRFLRKWANTQHLIPADNVGNNSVLTESENKSYFHSYLEEGNPFDKMPEEEEGEDVFSANGVS